MPADIVGGMITYVTQQLGVTVWDGELPRYDTTGNPINQNAGLPDWPVIKIYMKEGGFTREWTTEDPYTDAGEILLQVWSTTRASVQTLLNSLEGLLAQASKWPFLVTGGPMDNPYYVISCLLQRWYVGQEEGVRTSGSELLYRGELHYEVLIHGAIVSA
jgi:hypothetical protein